MQPYSIQLQYTEQPITTLCHMITGIPYPTVNLLRACPTSFIAPNRAPISNTRLYICNRISYNCNILTDQLQYNVISRITAIPYPTVFQTLFGRAPPQPISLQQNNVLPHHSLPQLNTPLPHHSTAGLSAPTPSPTTGSLTSHRLSRTLPVKPLCALGSGD